MSQDICQWIETHADFVPEKLAIRFEGREITYRQLLLQIRTTAAVLKASHDIGRGDRIAYLGFNSPEMLVLFCLCAAGCCVIATQLATDGFGADLYSRKFRGQDTGLR